MKANPGGYIPPEHVVGRDKLIERLWRILDRQSLVLTAERRMGKTSILRKMEAEPATNQLPVFHELAGIRSPLAFVQTIFDDVRDYLSRSNRTARHVTEFFRKFKGVEIGGLVKIPEDFAGDWQPLLSRTIQDLIEHQEDTLVFLWDEMPLMVGNIKADHGEKVAMELLDTLRDLRQTHPTLRMVYTGSIGLHHVITALKQAGYANAPTNDMHKVDVPPLSPEDAQALALQLLKGEAVEADEPEKTAQEIADAVDCCPYYIHHVVDALLDQGGTIDEIVGKNLTASGDPWDLRHYHERIGTYYTPEQRPFVLNLLDVLATTETPISFDELFNRLKSKMETEDSDTVRNVLRLLQDDHYITHHQDGTFQFQFSIVQRWWQLERGLAT